MKSDTDRLRSVVERLQAQDLIPPVKTVEMGGGGWIRVSVVGRVAPDVRARLAAAMGSVRWKLVESSDDGAAGIEFSPERPPE